MAPPILSIDIGNTHTDFGLIDLDTMACRSHVTVPTRACGEECEGALHKSLGGLSPASLQAVVICSVVKLFSRTVEQTCRRCAPGARIVQARCDERLPLRFDYENTAMLGIDRIADCLYGHVLFPEKNQIIIDAGTTVTVDVLKNGTTFAGGTIVPGVPVQLQSLRSGTAALPDVTPDRSTGDLPGRSTQACMVEGVLHSVAGGINLLVHRYREQLGDSSVVLTTGGAWKYTRHLIDFRSRFNPDMTLVGIALFSRWL